MGDTAIRSPLSVVDFTIKADADTLGNGWVDGHAWDPDVYEPLGIRDGALVCTDPESRAVTYAEDQVAAGEGDIEGELLGIGCAWRPTIYDAPTVTMEWAGWAPDEPQEGAWVEGALLVNVVPGTPEHGFGVWCSGLADAGFLIVGSISNPSYDFHDRVLTGAVFTHTPGTTRTIQLVSNGTGVTVWLDGNQVTLGGYGTSPVPIPTNLLGSRMHGLAVDAHLSLPSLVPSTPAAYSWSIEAT